MQKIKKLLTSILITLRQTGKEKGLYAPSFGSGEVELQTTHQASKHVTGITMHACICAFSTLLRHETVSRAFLSISQIPDSKFNISAAMSICFVATSKGFNFPFDT